MTIQELKRMLSFEVALYGPVCPLSYVVQRFREQTMDNPIGELQEDELGDWMMRMFGGYTRNDF